MSKSRIFVAGISVVVVASIIFGGGSVFAEEGDSTQTSSKLRDIQNIAEQNAQAKLAELCARYATPKINSDISQKQSEFVDKLSKKKEDLSGKRTEWDEKREQARIDADTKRQEHYDKLMERATTEDQKNAVVAFEEAVEKAVETRRAALDTARLAYRSGIDTALENRRVALEQSTETYRQSIADAYDRALASCQAGTGIATVKATLKSDLESSRQNFRQAKEQIGDFSETVRLLAETRKVAFEDAKTAFQLALEQARQDLEAVLGEDQALEQ